MPPTTFPRPGAALILALLLPLTACAGGLPPPPEDTRLVLYLDANGEVVLSTDQNGEPIEPIGTLEESPLPEEVLNGKDMQVDDCFQGFASKGGFTRPFRMEGSAETKAAASTTDGNEYCYYYPCGGGGYWCKHCVYW
jgi:hypothetical protein